MQSRLAELERRLLVLETRRPPTFTPFSLSAIGGGPNGTLNFTWNGGRLWVAGGGEAASSVTTGVDTGITVTVNAFAFTPGTEMAVEGPTTSGGLGIWHRIALPFRALEIPTANLSTSSNVLTATTYGASTVGAQFSGFIIEWPFA